jgi:hypothetical protein
VAFPFVYPSLACYASIVMHVCHAVSINSAEIAAFCHAVSSKLLHLFLISSLLFFLMLFKEDDP